VFRKQIVNTIVFTLSHRSPIIHHKPASTTYEMYYIEIIQDWHRLKTRVCYRIDMGPIYARLSVQRAVRSN